MTAIIAYEVLGDVPPLSWKLKPAQPGFFFFILEVTGNRSTEPERKYCKKTVFFINFFARQIRIPGFFPIDKF